MAWRVEVVAYRPKTILNRHKRPDLWFWTRYTAYPYKGCQHRCFFCPCSERRYCPFEDADLAVRDGFGYVIQVKENAPDLLRRLLSLTPVDVADTGDDSAPDSPNCERVREMECLAPPVEKRFAAMQQLVRAGILEDTPQDVGLIYRQMGVKGLEGIESVGPKLAQVVEALIRQWL